MVRIPRFHNNPFSCLPIISIPIISIPIISIPIISIPIISIFILQTYSNISDKNIYWWFQKELYNWLSWGCKLEWLMLNIFLEYSNYFKNLIKLCINKNKITIKTNFYWFEFFEKKLKKYCTPTHGSLSEKFYWTRLFWI
jgi:glycosyltransferase involved in cell wall biosynthesis